MEQNENPNLKRKSATIIGAGIGGLYSAWELSKNGFDVTVLEKQNFVGGFSTSIQENNYKIDIGPHYAILPKSSEITNDILEIMGENLIEIPKIQKWHKSYFKGKIINGSPTIYHAILSSGINSILKTLFSYMSAKISSSTKNAKNAEAYLTSLYGNYLFQSWCKPYIIQNKGDLDLPLDYVTKKFKPITFSKIFKKFFSKKQNIDSTVESNEMDGLIECYFKDGIGQLSDTLSEKIKENNGKIILGANVETIAHDTQMKNIQYTHNGKSVEHKSDIIVYTTPFQLTKKWFLNQIETTTNYNFHSIMIFLFIDAPQIFDGWALEVFDTRAPYFRIAQQTFLSKHVAPPNKTLLSIEIRSNDNDPLWNDDNTTISKKIEQSLRDIGLLKNEIVDGSKVIKLKHVYPHSFKKSNVKSDSADFMGTIKNEYALDASNMDSGRLLSREDDLSGNVSFGGIFVSMREYNHLIKNVILKN